MELNYLTVPFGKMAMDDTAGTFVGFANVYGVEDLQGDVVEKGAFTKTLAERPVVKVLFNHNPNLPVGKGTLSDSPRGLVLSAELNLDLSLAREIHSNLKKGILDSLSIGYDVVKATRGAGVRLLKELRVHEVSVVTFPANPLAQIQTVKAEAAAGGALFARWRSQLQKMRADLDALQLSQLARDLRAGVAALKRR